MLLPCFSVLLALAGGIHSTKVPADFSFEVSQEKLEVGCAHVGHNAVISCKTNDPSANISLKPPPESKNAPSKNGKITRKGQTFTIRNVILHDGGKYQCVAESSGQVIKKYVYLLVAGIPNLVITPPEPKRVVPGSTVKYTCQAKGLVCDMLQWSRVSGSMVGVKVTPAVRENGTWRTDLLIEKAEFSHSGDYKCSLSYGQTLLVQRSVKVAVSAPSPVRIISYSPRRMTLHNSNDVLVKCRATGFPYPEITWKKDDKVIKYCRYGDQCATSTRYLRTLNGLLIIQPRYPDDDGLFRCEAKNAFGSDERAFDVIIPAAPVLSQSVQTVFFYNYGQTKPVEIPCVLKEGSPDPVFSWSFSNQRYLGLNWWSVTMKDWFVVEHDPGSSKSTLKIVKFPNFPLKFRCLAKNSEGQDEKEFTLYNA